MADTDVIIRQGQLLSGLIDKAHCGATLASVVHCYYELYGKRCAADLVSAFSKLFTLFLQYYRGFTLGIEGNLMPDNFLSSHLLFKMFFCFHLVSRIDVALSTIVEPKQVVMHCRKRLPYQKILTKKY